MLQVPKNCVPERRLGRLALVPGNGVGSGRVDRHVAVGDVEEGDEVGAELKENASAIYAIGIGSSKRELADLDAHEALEVSVAHNVGRHVADERVEALQQQGQLGAVLARVPLT